MVMIRGECLKCGHTFPFPLPGIFSNSIYSGFVGNSTSCPKCGGPARLSDAYTDSRGQLHIYDFANHIRQLNDPQRLREIQTSLEAANDETTAAHVAEKLAAIEPSLAKFGDVIRGIPPAQLASFLNYLLALVVLLIALHTSDPSKDNDDDNTHVENAQHSEQIYGGLVDPEMVARVEGGTGENEKRIDAMIEKLSALDEQRSCSASPGRATPQDHYSAKPLPRVVVPEAVPRAPPKTGLKGRDRNKPCPCGSGKKAKNCHQDGYNH